MANEIFERLKPYLKEIHYMENSLLHVDYKNRANAPSAQFIALNERLRFLKYGRGEHK